MKLHISTTAEALLLRRLSLLLAIPVLVMAGCGGGSGSGSGSASPSTPAAPTSSCAGLKAGVGGAVQVFCGGSATAKVALGTKTKTLTGGSCFEQGGQLGVNLGAVVGPDFPSGSPKPDYMGVIVPDGSSDAQAFSVHIDGAGGIVVGSTATTTADKKSITAKGSILGGDPVEVDVSC